jgi:acyl-CoA thioesterase I
MRESVFLKAALLGVVLVAGCTSGAEGGSAPAERAELQPVLEPRGGDEGSVPRHRLLFVGTSLTEGLGLDRPEVEAWPAQVGALAKSAGFSVQIRNAGLSGETSAGARRRLECLLDGERFDLFILETGANDGLRGLSPEDLEENLNAIFGAVREREPAARLVLIGMQAPSNLGEAYTNTFRSIFPRVAERWGATLVPFLLDGVAGEPSLNQADRIHPTAEGQAIMAQVAWPWIESVLEARESASP